MIKLKDIINEIENAQTGYYGEWIGHYNKEGHLVNQVVKIIQEGPIIKAIKVTGDQYIPANQPTWEYSLQTKKAKGWVSEEGGKNSFTVPADLKVVNHDTISITWNLPDGKKSEVFFVRDES